MPDQTEPPPPPALAAAALRGRDLLLVVALTAALLVITRLVAGGQARTTELMLLMLAVQSAIPLAAIQLVIVRGRGVPWSAIGLKPAPRGWNWRAVLLAFLVLPAVMLVNAATQMLAGGPLRNPQVDLLAPIAASRAGVIGLLIMAGIVAPIVEEIVFRGLFYGWLRARFGVAVGAVVSGLVFAAVHGVPMLIPALFVHGVVLAVVFERSGSLWPPVIIHGTFNAVMVLALAAALEAGVVPP